MCDFCETIKISKEIKNETKVSGRRMSYKVSLIEITLINGRKRGTYTNRPVPIRYCPECGKKM